MRDAFRDPATPAEDGPFAFLRDAPVRDGDDWEEAIDLIRRQRLDGTLFTPPRGDPERWIDQWATLVPTPDLADPLAPRDTWHLGIRWETLRIAVQPQETRWDQYGVMWFLDGVVARHMTPERFLYEVTEESTHRMLVTCRDAGIHPRPGTLSVQLPPVLLRCLRGYLAAIGHPPVLLGTTTFDYLGTRFR